MGSAVLVSMMMKLRRWTECHLLPIRGDKMCIWWSLPPRGMTVDPQQPSSLAKRMFLPPQQQIVAHLPPLRPMSIICHLHAVHPGILLMMIQGQLGFLFIALYQVVSFLEVFLTFYLNRVNLKKKSIIFYFPISVPIPFFSALSHHFHLYVGLINDIMSKGRRMTYEELCNAVLPV